MDERSSQELKSQPIHYSSPNPEKTPLVSVTVQVQYTEMIAFSSLLIQTVCRVVLDVCL